MTKMAAIPIHVHMVKHFKNLLSGNHCAEFSKLCMKHQRSKLFIIYANYDPGLTLTYFTARSNFATWAFTWENETMMDS